MKQKNFVFLNTVFKHDSHDLHYKERRVSHNQDNWLWYFWLCWIPFPNLQYFLPHQCTSRCYSISLLLFIFNYSTFYKEIQLSPTLETPYFQLNKNLTAADLWSPWIEPIQVCWCNVLILSTQIELLNFVTTKCCIQSSLLLVSKEVFISTSLTT